MSLLLKQGCGKENTNRPVGLSNSRQRIHQRIDYDHVHHRHAAHGGIEATLAKLEQLGHAGGVDADVFDLPVLGCCPLPSRLEKILREIAGDNAHPSPAKDARVVPVAAGNVKNRLPRLKR